MVPVLLISSGCCAGGHESPMRALQVKCEVVEFKDIFDPANGKFEIRIKIIKSGYTVNFPCGADCDLVEGSERRIIIENVIDKESIREGKVITIFYRAVLNCNKKSAGKTVSWSLKDNR